MSKNEGLQGWTELKPNPGQNIWNTIENSSKAGQDKKSLISNFVCFFTDTAKI